MTFKDYFLRIVGDVVCSQSPDGSMSPGHNGLYMDPETPVRNTSHYLIAFTRAHDLSGDTTFYDAAIRCLDWLLQDNDFREGYTFHHRTKAGKDRCNGLIGPAWNMEALLFAGERYDRPKARDLARELFLLHPFLEDKKIWVRVEPDGTLLSLDSTFNHQLWFAACAAPLAKDTPIAHERIKAFLDGTKHNWHLARNGRILHPLWLPERRTKETIKRIIKPGYRRYVVSREVGYHAFNLYAFALLKNVGIQLPEHADKKMGSALNYLDCSEFVSGIEKSEWGYSYNPPGWEVSVALSILRGVKPEVCRPWLERQISHSYDPESRMLSRGTPDSETHTARIYEAARLSDSVFDINLKI